MEAEQSPSTCALERCELTDGDAVDAPSEMDAVIDANGAWQGALPERALTAAVSGVGSSEPSLPTRGLEVTSHRS